MNTPTSEPQTDVGKIVLFYILYYTKNVGAQRCCVSFFRRDMDGFYDRDFFHHSTHTLCRTSTTSTKFQPSLYFFGRKERGFYCSGNQQQNYDDDHDDEHNINSSQHTIILIDVCAPASELHANASSDIGLFHSITHSIPPTDRPRRNEPKKESQTLTGFYAQERNFFSLFCCGFN